MLFEQADQHHEEDLGQEDAYEQQLVKAFKEFVLSSRQRRRTEKELQKHAAECKIAWQRMRELGEPETLAEKAKQARGKK